MPDGIRVVCVDDDPDTLEVLGLLLERSDNRIAVTTVDRPRAALEAVERSDCDCVVSDYDMPGMDGLELLQAIREIDAKFPFVLYTGKGSEGLASEAIAAGVTDYVPKGTGTEQYEVLANRIVNAVSATRARRAREESKHELAKYRTLVERAGDPMYALDESGRCILANDALASFTGRDRDEIQGAHFSAFLSTEQYDRATAAIQDLAGSDAQTTIEFTIEGDGADDRVGEANVTALADEDGSFIGSVGIVRDISARKRRERELAQYETIVETVPEGILVLDRHGHVEWTNDRFVEYMDYSEEEVAGKHFLEFVEDGIFDSEIIARYQDIVRDLLSSSNDVDVVTYAVESFTPIGGLRHFEAKTALLPLENGEYDGTVTAFRDVTETVEYRRELERQNERLEQFAQFVSHDLRNPINVAEGHLDILAERYDDDSIEMATWAVDRMEDLIDDMLTMAKQGQSVEDVTPVTLSSLAHESWSMVDTDECELTVESDIHFGADRRRVTALFENLFRNAAEHAGSDVHVRVGALDDYRDDRGFFVEDNGEGLEDMEQIFEFGYTTTPDGTGFGLGIVEQIAGAHGWDVTATEGQAGGARFEFRGVDPQPRKGE